MRFNFRKISAVASSILMVGMTMGAAAAASFPAPFVSGGSSDVAIVTGASAAATDVVAATNIQSALNLPTTAVGSESVSIGSSADKIWLNTSLDSVKTTFGETDLPTVLADQTFDGDVSAKMTHTIKLVAGDSGGGDNSGKVIFARQPKSSNDPVVGISLGTSQTANPLYNETVTFSQAVNFTDSDSESQAIKLFGKDFTVSTDTSTTALVLFESAQKLTLTNDGTGAPSATVTIEGVSHVIELLNGDSTSATISVDGVSGTVNEGSSKKINGVQIAVTDAVASTAAGITATVLAGAEKLTFTSGTTVTKGDNNDPIDGSYAYIVGGTGAATELTVTIYRPESSDDAIVEGGSFVDPVFGGFKVDFSSLSHPLDDTSVRDLISLGVGGDDTMTLTMTDSKGNKRTFDFAHNESTQWFLGDDVNNTIKVVEMSNLTTDKYILLGNEDNGHILQLDRIYNNTGTDKSQDRVTFTDIMSGETVDSVFSSTEGSGTLTLDGKTYTVTFSGNNYAQVKYPTSESANSSTFVVYPTIKTSSGAKVALFEPISLNLTDMDGAGTNASLLQFPDGDGYTGVMVNFTVDENMGSVWYVGGNKLNLTQHNISHGVDSVNITIGQLVYNVSARNTGGAAYNNDTVNISLILPGVGQTEADQPGIIVFEPRDDSSNYHAIFVDLESTPGGSSTNGVGVNTIAFTSPTHYSASLQSDSDITKDMDLFGTLTILDSSESDQKIASISVPKEQMYANLYISSNDVTAAGSVLVKDSEVSSVSTKNLIVVGGSCINAVAAKVLGSDSPLCESSFTSAVSEKTAKSVGAGQFVVWNFASPYNAEKIAMLVAGYEAADTTSAANYVTTNKPSTMVGTGYGSVTTGTVA